MNLNSKLAIAAVILLVLSLYSYIDTTRRADRFERGQKFLQQLNPDNIARIDIVKDGETVTLRKNDDKFLVASKHDYPAKNEAINRFIKDVLEMSLEKEVGSSESLQKELQVHPDESVMDVAMKNDAGNEMVRFLVGKNAEDGSGAFIRRLDGDVDHPIYRTSQGIYLSATNDAFLDKTILDVEAGQIASVQGSDFTLSKESGSLALQDLPAGKKTGSNFSSVTNLLSDLRFDKVFLADDNTVARLNYDRNLVVNLDDESSYTVRTAVEGEKYYLTIQAALEVGQISITREESEEELEKKSEILMRNDEIQEFNQFHGTWVYEVSEITAKKFRYNKADLIEDETPAEGE